MTSASSPQGLPSQSSPKIVVNNEEDISGNVLGLLPNQLTIIHQLLLALLQQEQAQEQHLRYHQDLQLP